MLSKLESEVTVPISTFINENPRVRALQVLVEGQLVRDNQNLRVSNARVVVRKA